MQLESLATRLLGAERRFRRYQQESAASAVEQPVLTSSALAQLLLHRRSG
jgi:hypothetical protein